MLVAKRSSSVAHWYSARRCEQRPSADLFKHDVRRQHEQQQKWAKMRWRLGCNNVIELHLEICRLVRQKASSLALTITATTTTIKSAARECRVNEINAHGFFHVYVTAKEVV